MGKQDPSYSPGYDTKAASGSLLGKEQHSKENA